MEDTVDITPYLESLGISLVEQSASQVAVTAIIEQKETKAFDFPTSDIKISGLPSEYELNFSADTLTVNVRERREDMETLTQDNIEALLDVTDLTPGTYTRQLTINLPGDKYEVLGIVNVQFVIVDKTLHVQEEDVQPTNPNDEQDGNADDEEDNRSEDDEQPDDTGRTE